MSLGALGDSFYEYLLKAWIQSGQTDEEARNMFEEAMTNIIDKMVRTSNGGLIYVSDLKFDHLEHKMDHLACFAGKFIFPIISFQLGQKKGEKRRRTVLYNIISGGLFALGASTRQNEYTTKFMEIGKGITNTCHETYARSNTQLGPEAFRYVQDMLSVLCNEMKYILIYIV